MGGFSLLLLTLAPGFGPADGTKAEITRLSRSYDAALKQRDHRTLDRLLHDDGQFILSDGQKLDKKNYIARLTRPEMVLETGDSQIESIRLHAETAIETGIWRSTATVAGKKRITQERYTVVWIRHAGRWQIVSEQVTAIPPTKSPTP